MKHPSTKPSPLGREARPPAPRRPFRHPAARLLPALVLVSAVVVAGCSQGTQEEEAVVAPAERVENAELGLAIAALPAFFRVASNEGATLVLEPASPDVEGTLTISAGEPTDGGINLVRAVEEHRSDIESRPDGDFKGQRELGSQLGVAFYSRGRFTGGEGAAEKAMMEETAIFSIHPEGDRRLNLVYVYPAGDDTAARLQEQLFEVLGELEGLFPPGAEEAGSDAGEPAAGAG